MTEGRDTERNNEAERQRNSYLPERPGTCGHHHRAWPDRHQRECAEQLRNAPPKQRVAHVATFGRPPWRRYSAKASGRSLAMIARAAESTSYWTRRNSGVQARPLFESRT